jgi:CheY-like chemotaxis protein
MSEPRHILLVDDNRMEVGLALAAFREACAGCTSHVARDDEQAMDYLLGRGPYADRHTYPLPDLVLLDLKMPAVDRYEMLRQIKTTPGLKRLPVVILTSSNDESDRALCYESGANSYVLKPVSFDGFLEVIEKIAPGSGKSGKP